MEPRIDMVTVLLQFLWKTVSLLVPQRMIYVSQGKSDNNTHHSDQGTNLPLSEVMTRTYPLI